MPSTCCPWFAGNLCRGIALIALISFPAAAQKSSESAKSLQARVWVNTNTKVYHCPGDAPYYGNTKDGEFMVEAAARGSGYRAASGNGCKSMSSGRAPLPKGMSARKNKLVWVNTESRVYHCPGASDFGLTKRGRYLAESDALAEGAQAAGGKKCWKGE